MYSVINVLADEQQDKLFPKARGGIIELSDIDFTRSSSLPLSGKWSFYWKKLLSFEDLQRASEQAKFALVPHVWLDMPDESNEPKKYGYATYKVRVKVSPSTKQLALRVPAIGSAYKLYINDELLASGGEVGTSVATAIPSYQAGIFEFTVPDESFDIIVQVSNYDMIWGGLWEDIRMGESSQLHIEQSRKNFRTTFIIGIFLTIAAFNLIQFSLRAEDFLPLVTSLTCLLLALRDIEQSQILAFMDVYYFDYYASIRISFLTFYVTTSLIVAYFYLSFTQEYNKRIIYVIFGISALLSLHALLVPPISSSYLIPYFQIMVIGVIFYITWGLLLAVIRKRPTANFIFLGTIVLFSLVGHDILISLRVIDGMTLVSFGLVALIMCQNYATYSTFILAAAQNKHLSIELSEQNVELEKFSKSLEELVDSRTAQLSTANNQLEVLAYNDSLTSVLNRRGLLQHIEKAKHLFDTNNTPFCLLLIDFDLFKKLNDTLGHEVGDIVLVEGAKKMTSAVRENDKVGRWGGEEFLILLNDVSIAEAKDIAEGVRVVIAEIVSHTVNTRVTISIGVSQFNADETIEKSINRADAALYQAKDAGRNQVVLAQS
jgi:diguanylate cyclase (GGDEF)-like protein